MGRMCGVEHALEAGFDGLGVEGGTVVEENSVPKFEGVNKAVGRDLPRLCEGGFDLEGAGFEAPVSACRARKYLKRSLERRAQTWLGSTGTMLSFL